MRKPFAVLSLLLLAACASAPPSPRAAHSDVFDAAGTKLGHLMFEPAGDNTRIVGTLQGLPAGVHALHIHAIGQCTPPFTTAGPHFNPANVPHGLATAAGGHAGDLPNFTVGADGRVTIDVVARASLGGENPIVDGDGAAIVVHEKADDERTDPAGNAGARIACGVITH